MLDGLGRPDRGLTFLHVAGTNGKGSVCANLAGLLRAVGYRRVGLYTSPHLVSFRERILVDGEPIPSEYIVTWLRGAQDLILKLNATYFECVTALALDYFRVQGCEAVVLETGLGGRLDATNAVTPKVTAVTSISLDHTSILGDTVEAIWREKIGILKPGVPMVVAERRENLLADLMEKAGTMGSPVFSLRDYPAPLPMVSTSQASPGPGPSEVEAGLVFQGRYAQYRLPGDLRKERHQIENLALSLLTMETFLRGPLPDGERLTPLLRSALPAGRTQLLQETGRLPVLLDGAHNPGGMEVLGEYIRREFPGRRIRVLFSVMRDKDFTSVLRTVRGFASEVLFMPLGEKFPRALSFAELQSALPPEENAMIRPFELTSDNADEFLRFDPQGPDMLVVCGSLYLLGEVIPLLLPHYRQLEGFRRFVGEG